MTPRITHMILEVALVCPTLLIVSLHICACVCTSSCEGVYGRADVVDILLWIYKAYFPLTVTFPWTVTSVQNSLTGGAQLSLDWRRQE